MTKERRPTISPRNDLSHCSVQSPAICFSPRKRHHRAASQTASISICSDKRPPRRRGRGRGRARSSVQIVGASARTNDVGRPSAAVRRPDCASGRRPPLVNNHHRRLVYRHM